MGETRQAVERSVEVWNAHDRNGWLQLGSDDVDLLAPGGLVATGSATQYDRHGTACSETGKPTNLSARDARRGI
jgi:hypothetical protein